MENIVYYKDDTHYFVMTAKKQSLLDKGVILQVGTHLVLQTAPPTCTSATRILIESNETLGEHSPRDLDHTHNVISTQLRYP